MRSVRNRHTVSCAKTAKAPALHRSSKTLALRYAGNIDQLSRNEMVSADVRADGEKSILGHSEFSDLCLGFDLGLAELDPLGLCYILRLRLAGSELNGGIAVTIHFTTAYDPHIVQLQDGDRHMPTVRLEQTGHSDLLRDHAGAHDQYSSTKAQGI